MKYNSRPRLTIAHIKQNQLFKILNKKLNCDCIYRRDTHRDKNTIWLDHISFNNCHHTNKDNTYCVISMGFLVKIVRIS